MGKLASRRATKPQRAFTRWFLLISLLITSVLVISPDPVSADGETSLPAQMNKSFTPDLIPMGGEAILSVNIYNPNYFALALSTIPAAWIDTLPDGVKFVSPAETTTTCGGTVVINGQDLSLMGGTVPAQVGDTPGSCTVTAKVTSTVAGNHDNVIQASTLNATDPTGTISVTNTTPATHTLQVNSLQPPSLSKSFSPNTQWVGQTSQLSIHIRNNDLNYPLTETRLSDNLPENVVIADSSISFSNCGTSAYVLGPGGVPLAADQASFTIYNATIQPNTTCTVKVNVTSVVPDVYVNTIPANAIQTQQAVTNSSAASAPINFQSIGLSKSFSPSVIQAGGTSTLTITLRNPSDSDYTGVGLTDNLPAGLTLAATPSSPQCGGIVTSTSDSITLTGGTIPAGDVLNPGSCTITALVTSLIAGSFTNTIPSESIITDQGATNIADASSNVGVYGGGEGITGSKRFSPTTIAADGISRLTINISAPADTALTNFNLSDALPAGVQVAATPNPTKNSNCVGGTFSPSAGDTLLTYTGGSIPAGTTCSLAVYVTASEPGSYVNVISPANISNDEDRNISGNISRALTVSGVTVSKSFYPNSVNLNGLSVLTVVLQNVNTSTLEDVTFSDTLPSGVVIADDPDPSTTCVDAILDTPAGGSTFSMSGGKIPAQVGSVPGICTVNITVKGTTTGTKTNRIPVGAVTGVIQGSGFTVSNPAAATANLVVSDLTVGVVKSFDPLTVFGGSASTMTVRLTNPNNAALTDINFTDDLPQSTDPLNLGGMTIAQPAQASTGTCGGAIIANPGDTSFSFSGGYLDVNTSCELSVHVTMDVSGNLTNTIPEYGVSTSNGAYNSQSASATLTNLPGVSLTKYFVTNTIQEGIGNVSTVAILIQNTGNVDLTGLGFTDTLPAGVEVAAAPAPEQCGGTLSTTSDSITLEGGSLLAEQDCTLYIDVTAPSAGTYENCIDAGAITSDQEATNADSTCDTLNVEEALQPPSITKAFSPNPARVGQISALTFTITNPNDSTMNGVAFLDDFPTGLLRASIPNVSQCGGTVSSTDTSVQLQNGSIAANGSCTITIAVRADAAGDYLNTSQEVSATDGGTGNTASSTLQVIAPPQISKVFDADTIIAGATSTLTFTITNPPENTVGLAGISFTDDFPVGIERASLPVSSQCAGEVTSTSSSITLTDGSLEVGESCTISIDITAPNAGVFNNTSEAVTSTNGGTGNTTSDTLTVTGVGLSLEKTSQTPNFKAVGDSLSYLYQLTNTGDTVLYAPFTVTDDRIGTINGCGGVSELQPGQTISCTAQYTVTSADITAETVVNTALANAKDELNQDVTSNQSSAEVKYAGLTLIKTTSTQSFFDVGDTINYSYTITNTGNITLYSPFLITDDHFVTSQTCGNLASLPPGGVVSCSRTYTVTADDVLVGSVTNVAQATAQDASSEGEIVTSNTDSVTVNKVSAPIISKIFSPDNIQTGGLSTLTFTITNPNQVSLDGVSFVDNLPAAMEPASTPAQSQCGGTVVYDSDDNRITLTDGFIIPGGSCTVSVVVTSSTPGDHLNQSNAVESDNGGTGNTAQDTLHVMSAPYVTKAFHPTTIIQSETSTLTLVISNPSGNTQELTGVAFQDFFPAGLYVANAAAVTVSGCGIPAFSPNTGDTSLSFSGGTIAIGGTCTITVPVAASSSGLFFNSTEPVTSTNGGTGLGSNDATLQVKAAADLSIIKDDGNIAVQRGEALTYSVRVVNNGPSDVLGAAVTDTFPSTLLNVVWTCAADAGARCTPSGSGDINDSVDLQAGTSITYTITADVVSDAETNILNSATVLPPVGLTDPNLNNNIQTDTDLLNRLQLEKDADQPNYDQIGQVLSYTYTVTNIGTSTLFSPFVLTDDLAVVSCNAPVSLAPQEQFTCSGTYAVTLEDLDDGSITNHASITGNDADGDEVQSNTAEETVLADQQPLIGIAKRTLSVVEVSAGTYDVTFEFLVKNYGNVTLTEIQVTDDLTSTFPSPTTFSVQTIASDNFSIDNTYDGVGQTHLLQSGNTLAADEEKVITLVVRVIPTSSGPFENVAVAQGEHPTLGTVTDRSQDGVDPDPDGNDDPTDNNDRSTVNFGAELFDPPYGRKDYDASGRPILNWTMVWINNTNIVDIYGVVHDPIPENTSFYPTVVDSGYPVPAGEPDDSTSLGVSCTSSSDTITTLCYYQGPTLEHPRGQVIWEGTIGPDLGVTDPVDAVNALTISFNVLLEDDITSARNEAAMDVDRNGDGDVDDLGEQTAILTGKTWEVDLPDTGFAPDVVVSLPDQPQQLAYTEMDELNLEIPVLDLDLSIVGVPQTVDGGWNITWLGDSAGWLQGTAFPTWQGNSVITAHVVDSNGLPGPFADLQNLRWGDQIIIHAWDQDYIYEVRQLYLLVDPHDLSVISSEELPWLTLITCRGYDETTDSYQWRVVVRAVQVAVE